MTVSTGSRLRMTREEHLRAATATNPEIASLNVGRMNFGIVPMAQKYPAWKHAWEPELLETTRDCIVCNTVADRLFGDDDEWSVLAAGRHQKPFTTQSALLDGNVRVGMEDSRSIGPGQKAVPSAEHARTLRAIVENPGPARTRPGPQGRDRVAFSERTSPFTRTF